MILRVSKVAEEDRNGYYVIIASQHPAQVVLQRSTGLLQSIS